MEFPPLMKLKKMIIEILLYYWNTIILFHNSDYILYGCNRIKYKNKREENPIQSNFEKEINEANVTLS